jgi:GNAT superfamily N-acetyltransferase
MNAAATAFPFADVGLARRLERVEALSTSRFVEARARLAPSSGACWIEVAGAYAMFDGVSSPVTQTFGLGMWQAPTAADFDELEGFFREHGAPIYHEVSPLADPSTFPLLNDRGYHPFEFTSVMYRPVVLAPTDGELRHQNSDTETPTPELRHQSAAGEKGGAVTVRQVTVAEADLYARTAAAGWSESGYGDFMRDMARVGATAAGGHLFVAELEGQPIATGALNIHEGVAHFAGASTVPEGRRRGAQLALLNRRLEHAASAGCDIAAIGASPGSGSQRNAERHGFRIAYTRVKYRLS